MNIKLNTTLHLNSEENAINYCDLSIKLFKEKLTFIFLIGIHISKYRIRAVKTVIP